MWWSDQPLQAHQVPQSWQAVDHMLTIEKIESIMGWWAAGWDTAQIAVTVGLPECQVAAIIPRILENKREARGLG